MPCQMVVLLQGTQGRGAPSAEEESEYSLCVSEVQEDWYSQTSWEVVSKDIDLTASEDILCDEDDNNDDDPLDYSQTSSRSDLSEGGRNFAVPSSMLLQDVQGHESFHLMMQCTRQCSRAK